MEGTKLYETCKGDMEHPYERANLISKGCFNWLLPYFIKGFKKDLTENDMYGPLKSHDAGMLGDELEKAWNYELINKENPSLWLALIKVFGLKVVLYTFYFLFVEFFILCQPLLISIFLKFYEPNQTEMAKNEAYIYAGLLVLCVLLTVLFAHHFLLHNMHLSMKIRVGASSLIYRKALKLNKSALAQATIGQMTNLLSNDAGRFNFATAFIYNLLLAPILIMVVPYLVYVSVGPTGLVGFGFILLFIPLLMYMAKKNSKYRLKTALRTDERVRLMNEIISGIQVIKMYTWEKPFAKLVEMSRKKEMRPIRATATLQAVMMSCNLVVHRTAIYLCILTYALTGNIINASFAYTVSSFYIYLQEVLTLFFPQAITALVETNVSVKRIQKFLLLEEIQLGHDNTKEIVTLNENKTNGTLPVGSEDKTVHIDIKNATVKWTNSLPENTLENITFNANAPQLIAVAGQVGGGKTTFLHAILGELTPVEGTVDIKGSLSYASQEPWIFAGTVRQNITFSQEFIPGKYEEVVRVCALDRDFTLLPFGDSTYVGDKGVTLSGGQKARISLARAIYRDADIYLLDDPLSAVDAQVGKQLFDDCICGYLKNKCVVLVTHQIQYLRNLQMIYLLRGGKIEASGSYETLRASESKFLELLTSSKDEVEDNVDEISRENKVSDIMESKKIAPDEEREERESGVVSWQVYQSYMVAGGSYFKLASLIIVFIICQITLSTTDYFINIWVNLELWRLESAIPFVNDTTAFDPNESNADKVWSSLNLILTKQVLIIIYTCLIVASILITFIRTVAFFGYCMTASTRLHSFMFSKIVHATMRFFNINPSGRILNRFSKDIGTIDEQLPRILLDTVQIGLTVLSIVLIIGSINPWILIPSIIMAIIFYFLRKIFLATSRDIKRVEAVTRSPIYTHLSASLHGLTTIRAFGAQEIIINEFDNIQNQNSAPYFMFLASNRAFAFWLDMHCVIYIALVTISILFIKGIPGGSVGLALTQSTNLLGMVQWGMRQWSELENNMTSVERVQQYIKVPPEANEGTREPPQFWPEMGNIQFENLSLRYSPDEKHILKNITFEIKAKEKVGIVGRTGAGKSSLIAALFRLTSIDGKIIIDNIYTKEIPLNILRSKISIIPQEPVLFSGTLRKNLDPFDEYNDEILWSALAEVELKNAVSDLPAGLESKMSEGGSNFSVGQRQLLCLARASIRNNRILVLDEATANIDPHTDELIQITIRRKFADNTVLIIAHRLHTIMDSDKVLVMDAGKVIEFDHPHKLLESPDSVFCGLVKQTGKAMSDHLMSIAEKNYQNNVLL